MVLVDRLWHRCRLATLAPARVELGIVEDGVIAAHDGRIVYAGPTADALSGLDAECRQLRAARRLGHERPVTMRTTFLGAHALPPGTTVDRDAYIDVVCRLVSPWLARKDADWWIDRLYGFARDLGATIAHTAISRTVINVNRDPSGQSLYSGQATTGLCDASGLTRATNGRFKGGFVTRHYGRPQDGVHAIQMDLACRGYMREPVGAITPDNWPGPFDPAFAAPIRSTLAAILETCLAFARARA